MISLTTVRIAWRNLGRSRRRTALAVSAIALGQFTVILVNGLMAGSFREMLETVTGPLVGHVQIQHKEWEEERAIDLYVEGADEIRARIEAMEGVMRVSPRIMSAVLAARGEKTGEPADAEPAMIVGVDVGAEALPGGLLERIDPELLSGGRSVAVGQVLARRLGLQPGAELAVVGQDADGFPAGGLFKVEAVVKSGTELVNRLGVVMPLAAAEELLALSGGAHEIIVLGEDPKRAEELAGRVAALPGLSSARVLSWREAVPELAKMLDMKTAIDMIFIAILLLAATAGIANTALVSTFERTREFGMLLAVGCRPRRLVSIILAESVIVGFAGVAVGSLLGTAAVLITSHTGIDYAALGGVKGAEDADIVFMGMSISYVIHPVFEWRHVFMGLAGVTAVSMLASAWPAALAAKLKPVEAMRS